MLLRKHCSLVNKLEGMTWSAPPSELIPNSTTPQFICWEKKAPSQANLPWHTAIAS